MPGRSGAAASAHKETGAKPPGAALKTPSTPPRTPANELAELLNVPYPHFGIQPEGDRAYTVQTAVAEIQEWLEVQPTQNQQHQVHRDSLLADITTAFETRGPNVRQLTPAAEPLVQSMEVLLKRPAQGDAAAAQGQLDDLCAQLTEAATASAAFDDLNDMVGDQEAAPATVASRLAVLTDILAIADRPVAETCRRLGDIVDNRAVEIGFLRRDLDGTEAPVVDDDNFYASANLEFDDRLDLCRRYLLQPMTPAHHVVWVAYDDARVVTGSWREQVGPVEFFDGPTLLKAIEDPTNVPIVEPLPPELTTGYQASRLTRDDWPGEEHTHWVAARVDLGVRNVSDPVAVGRAQADGVVQYAFFKGTKSTWTPLAGFFHLVDGLARTWVAFRIADSHVSGEADYDTTAGWFGGLATEIGPHLPVTDRTLRRLLDTIRTLNTMVEPESPDYVGICVRVIEFVARQCHQTSWADFLKQNASVFAYNHMRRELFNAVQDVIHAFPIENRAELRKKIRTTQSDNRIVMHLDAALEMAPQLLAALPEAHHAATRRLAALVRRTSSASSVEQWVVELVAEHHAKVARTSRYRNGQTHGGAEPEVARTISTFVHNQARLVARRALEASLDGQDIRASFAQLRGVDKAWRRHVKMATHAADALFWTVGS